MASISLVREGTIYVNVETNGASARLNTPKGGVTLGKGILTLLNPLKEFALAGVQPNNGKPSISYPHMRVTGTYDDTTHILTATSVERAVLIVANEEETKAFMTSMAGIPTRQPRAATPAPSAPAPDASDEPRF